jgi:hypothetical protein
MQNKLLCLLVVILTLFFSVSALACGCGMALAPPEVFNSLKESQAYLIVDVHNQSSYTESPYFRFVSFDKEYDVKMVFPMKSLPVSVEGRKLSLEKFLDEEKISEFQVEEKQQDFSKALENIRRPIIVPALISGGGFVGTFIFGFFFIFTQSVMQASGAVDGALTNKGGLVAQYVFDGGTLDIYDVSSTDTLSQLVDKLGFTAEGEVKRLVDKYANYYVAVMTIHVPTVLPKEDLDFLSTNCKDQLEKTKALLQTKAKIEWKEIGIDPYDVWAYRYIDSEKKSCNATIVDLVNSATNPSSDVNGVMVSMSYNNSDIFYPTSIVNSYAYPVSEQSYFVRTPYDLQFTPSSNVSKTVLVGDKRWYVVTDTSTDLSGTINSASIETKASDSWLGFVKVLYNNSWIATIILILIFILVCALIAFVIFPKSRLSIIDVMVFVWFGFIIGSIVAFLRGKRKVAVLLFVVWLILLLISIV